MTPPSRPKEANSTVTEREFLPGGGEVGALMRDRDWSTSPLGAPETWPQSLRSVVGLLLTSKFPMFVAWGDELGFLYNDAYAEILGRKHPRALGSRFHDIWSEIWPDISPLIDASLAGQATYRENLPLLMNRSGFDEQTWFTFSYSPVRDESGKVAGMFCACTETTNQILAERRLQHIVDSAVEYAIITLDRNGGITTWNSGAERLLGYSEAEALGKDGGIFFTAEANAAGEPKNEMHIADREGRASNERWHVRKDGSRFWGSGVMLPMKDGSGSYLKIFRDQTEERRAEERRQVLINELNHRVKNTLATVQAIASQTLRGSKVEREIRDAFEARLGALAAGHDVLTAENWEQAELGQIIAHALKPFRPAGENQLIATGPALYVAPKLALSLTMALHELATNATKYGALSNETGCVRISWFVKGARWRLRWEESGGPTVTPPSRKGFGSLLIERSLASDLEAEVGIEFAPQGVVCTVEAPVAVLRDGGLPPP